MSISLKTPATLWYRLWFEPQSPAPICMFRILLAAIVFLSSLTWAPDLFTWFGYDGIVSVETMRQYEEFNRLSLLDWLPPDNRFVLSLYVLLLLSALSLMVGFKSRLSALILFICLASFHHRNLLIFHSGDTLMRVCLFLLLFGPIDRMYAIDSRGKAPAQASPWVQNLLRFQIAIVYAHSFFSKMEGSTWWDGTAIYYALHMEDFYRFPVPLLFDNIMTVKLATWSTLVIELALWTLIWIRGLRYYVLAAGVILHLGIDWSMNLPFFEDLMIASYVLFLKPEDIERFVLFVRQVLNLDPGRDQGPVVSPK
ncbi:MAG: HTTM domain-containing protein [Candidatus Obscuribacterales bacterium]|nr:HTTM domain-containing protein [Candidatus Obscuribacterales bacterium]